MTHFLLRSSIVFASFCVFLFGSATATAQGYGRSGAARGCQGMQSARTSSALTGTTQNALLQQLYAQQAGQNGATQLHTAALQLAALKAVIQNALSQLSALQQSGQLSTSQLQTTAQQQTLLQNFLAQINAVQQTGTVTAAQLLALQQQLRGLSASLQTTGSSARR